MQKQKIGFYQRLVIENHALTGAHSRGGAREVCKDKEGLAAHLGIFRCNDVDELAVCCKEGIKLGLQLELVNFVIEIVDIEGCVRSGHGGGVE